MILSKEMADRLNQAILDSGYRNADIARGSGVHATTIQRYRTAESSTCDKHKLDKVLDFLGVTLDWIRTGQEEKYVKKIPANIPMESAMLERMNGDFYNIIIMAT